MASMQAKYDEMGHPITTDPPQKESLQLIARVLEKTQELDRTSKKSDDSSVPIEPLKRVQYYTGLHENYLQKLKSGSTINFGTMTVDRSHIQNQLIIFYFKFKLPTTYELFHALHVANLIPEYMDIRSFRKTLVKFGYMWRKLSKNRNLVVVIERPKVTFERYFYLKNIIQYREEMRQIYFVDELILTLTCEVFDSDACVELKDYISKNTISNHVIYAVTDKAVNFTTFYTYDPSNIETWLQFELFRSVKPGSVVVLRNKKNVNQEVLVKPTLDSLKVEMKDWLDFYNVPYEENMSKIELYTLVEKFTNNIDKLYKIDNIAKTYGVEILRLPESINDLTSAHWLHKLILRNLVLQRNQTKEKDFQQFFQSFQEIISRVDDGNLHMYDEYVADEERKTLDTDMKIDKIMDDIVEIMKKSDFDNNCAEDSDLPSYSDSD